jgi:putative ABC transport system permease protein
MSVLSDLLERARALLFSGAAERDLDDELAFHLEREVEVRVNGGEDPEQARSRALIALGGLDQCKERVRDARGLRPLQDLGADVRYAVRGLVAGPAFTATTLVVLAVGLGATTVAFTLADAVLVSDLPYADAGRLVRVYQNNASGNRWALSTVDALAIREGQRSFDAFGLVSQGTAALTGLGRPEQVPVGWASAGFFRALGVSAASGRLIEVADEGPAAEGAVVVSSEFAASRLGGSGRALGRSFTVAGESRTVVGVLPTGIASLAGVRTDVWLAMTLKTPSRRGPFWLRGIGRLGPGVSLEACRRDLASISERIFPVWASSFRDRTARLTPVPLQVSIVGNAGPQIDLFALAMLLVWLAAVTNVATLVLVRASARGHEFAVRMALGADRTRLARLIVTEGLVLTLIAGLVGAALADWGVRLIATAAPDLPRVEDIAFGWRSAGFLAVLALATALLVGVPAVVAALARLRTTRLGASAHRVGSERRTSSIRSGLVVVEFALALPMLAGAGLLVQSLIHLQHIDPGFDPRGAVTMSIALPGAPRYPGYDDIQRFWRQLELRAAQVPGVLAAGLSVNLPPDEPESVNNFDLIDHPVPVGGAEPTSPWSSVSPGFFEALGVPLVAGRLFTEADSGEAPPVVIVSRSWAGHYYPGDDAVGKQMIEGGCTSCPPTTIVGVVGDVKYDGLAQPGEGIYGPLRQSGSHDLYLVARTTAPAEVTLRALGELVRSLDPDLPAAGGTLADRMDATLAPPRRRARLLGAFAMVAVLLAAVGIFGVMSYGVRQRRREIGVRLALGAPPSAMTLMVVRRGMRDACMGIALGVLLTLAGRRWLSSFLVGVSAADPFTIVLVALVVLAVGGAACWIPGRLASRIRPTEALATDSGV